MGEGLHETGELAHAEAAEGGLGGNLLEALAPGHLGADRLDRAHVGQHLDEEALAAGDRLGRRVDRLADAREDHPADDAEEKQHHHRDHRQRSTQDRDHDEEDRHERQLDIDERKRPGEEVADRLELLQARDLGADRGTLGLRRRQVEQVVERARAHDHVDARADVSEHARAHGAEDGIEAEHQRHAEGEVDQRRVRARADHLVVDHHREDRDRQCEQVERQAHGEGLRHDLAEALGDAPEPRLGERGRAQPLGLDLGHEIGGAGEVVLVDGADVAAVAVEDLDSVAVARERDAGAARIRQEEAGHQPTVDAAERDLERFGVEVEVRQRVAQPDQIELGGVMRHRLGDVARVAAPMEGLQQRQQAGGEVALGAEGAEPSRVERREQRLGPTFAQAVAGHRGRGGVHAEFLTAIVAGAAAMCCSGGLGRAREAR